VFDLKRIHAVASTELDDLFAFCPEVGRGS